MKLINFIKNYSQLLVFFSLKMVLSKPIYVKENLLLINTGFIGDLVVSSVLLENPEIFHNYDKVQFLIKKQYLELFNNYSGKVEFIGYNYNKYKFSIIYKFKLLSHLRKSGFKKCINLTAARGILNEELTHLVGAKEVIALNSFWEYLGTNLGKYFDVRYSKIISSDIFNEYEKHFELMRYLVGNTPELHFNNCLTFSEDNDIENENFKKYHESIVIAPFTSLMNREWKKEYYFETINKFKENYRIVLIGAKNQKKYLEELRNKDERIDILAGEMKLNEIPILLKSAKLFIVKTLE